MVFDPEKLVKGSKELTLANFRLSEQDLKKWAISCSEIRENIR
jgi:hypothetical protein